MAASLARPALFARLDGSRRILVAGAGGGFDVYVGLPIALALRAEGKEVSLANLTFTYLGGTDARFLAPDLAVVGPETSGEEQYFPERALARWLAARGLEPAVYALEKVGVRPLTEAYRALVRHLGVDAIVLVDGGTDLVVFGDEAGLGTPQEDAASLAAVSALDEVPTRLAAAVGFGIDAHHGICHAHFLENLRTLEADGSYLGAFSISQHTDEGAAFLDAVRASIAATPSRASLVNAQIAAALRGEPSDATIDARTGGKEVFVTPLMAIYFTLELAGLARRSQIVPLIGHTETLFEVGAIIEAMRRELSLRPRRVIPH